MTVREWLKKTYKIEFEHFQVTRPRVHCKDGYSISIQAGSGIYCTPRRNLKDGLYQTVELGFPSQEDELINEYAECSDYTETVYGYVPIDIVDQLLEKHGGIIEEVKVSE